MDEALALDLVGYDADERLIRGMARFGLTIDRFAFYTRCDEPRANPHGAEDSDRNLQDNE